jgi:hypothetical protein
MKTDGFMIAGMVSDSKSDAPKSVGPAASPVDFACERPFVRSLFRLKNPASDK